jgi:hypothetical protein
MAVLLPATLLSQTKAAPGKREWRTATPTELEALLPARAPVERERIETEMSSATGVIDSHGKMVAAVVLITAGYAANGKYSHYLLTQVPIRIGDDIKLQPGAYVVGWTREQDGLRVHVYEAATGVERGTSMARMMPQPTTVVPIKIWLPSDRSIIQIGRFQLPYTPLD